MYRIPRNALTLLLAAQILVILPHIGRLPIWLTLFCTGCIAWRIMVYQGRWSFPGKWIKTCFVFGGILGISVGYGTLLGLEPWVGILIVAYVLKLLEMHQQRDAYTVIVLGYFVALTEFLFEQSIPYALYMFFCVTLITGALLGLNRTADNVRPRQTLQRAFLMLLQSLPLMLVLFVLFPRISPLWTVPLQTNVAKTGVSDSLAPGDIAELVQSDELAFRATFDGEIPAFNDLYWRGLVLSLFDPKDQAWRHQTPGLYGRPLMQQGPPTGWEDNLEYLGDPIDYSIMLEPTNQNWMFSLDLPEMVEAEGVGMIRDFRFYSFREIRSRLRYEVTSYLDFRTDVELSPLWRYRYTLLPENDNPRTKALAADMRATSENDLDYVRTVLRMFAEQNFTYTLRPPTLSGNTIDQFLLESRRGFCEHFASSFVYLMRAARVPARVVVGYQGGEFNRRANYVAVYQFDAHAWAEVWIANEGWVRVDPTSVVAPERIERGLESAVADEETFLADVGLSFMKFRGSLWITELRLQISALNHYWDSWVVGYTPTVQMSLLNQYLGDVDRKTLGVILLASFFTIFALVGLFLFLKRSQHRLGTVDREYLRYCRYLARQELPRRIGEGPLDYAYRAAAARPDLQSEIMAVTRAYVKANYAEDSPENADELRLALRRLPVGTFA